MRMFVAVRPSAEAVDGLEDFVAPRRDAAANFRWTETDQWHLTLAFLGEVADRRIDDLTDRLARGAARRQPGRVAVVGGGAFPTLARAKVLYAAIEAADPEELRRLATGARAAGSKAGAPVAGGRFHPHLTLARLGSPVEATRWVRVLDAYRGPPWAIEQMVLVASHLGEGQRGRPRYETVQTFAVGRPGVTSGAAG